MRVSLGSVLLAGSVLMGLACDALESKDEPEAPGPATAPESGSDATAKSPPAPVTAPSLLSGVLDRAIEPPPDGGSTYRIDAYVAALVVEQLRHDPLPFMSWRNESADAPGPAAGYRVGPLRPDTAWERLGLREGDIIEAVNGVPTGQAGWVSEALQRAENRVTVTIFRDDVSFTLSFRLMGAMAWYGLIEEAGEDAPAGEEPEQVAVAGGATPGGGAEPGSGAEPGGGSGAHPSSSKRAGGGSSRPSSGGSSKPSSGGSSKPSSKNPVARCSSDSSCTLDKAYFDSLVRSPSKLESQANVVPAIRNDVFSGYKLKSVRSGSAVHQLGFRSGDKITHINGRDLTNDLEAMQLYMGLSGTRTFRVRYVRGGATRNKTIAVK